jgi:uncharacterized SAM-binding protein YcdF (DUF218 family)
MFLFLSKLLPLFIYPLGATCLLLTVVLILWWLKRTKWTPVLLGIALIILFLSSNGRFSHALVQSLEWQYLPTEIPTADAIVILGGMTRSKAYPRPDVDLGDTGDRLWYGANLYRDRKAPKIIISGGRIAWKADGDPEAEDVTSILVRMGIPKQDIILESQAVNTYENAIFTQPILKENNFNKILLVTSAMHMPRSMAIFKKLGINAIAAPTDFRVSQLEIDQPNAQLESVIIGLLPDEECLFHTTLAIREYIGILVYKLKGWL